MARLRIAAFSAFLLLTACSGSGGGSGGILGGGLQSCNPQTQVQLARPAQGQTGVGSINSIEIVANGNSNALGANPQSWQLQVQNNFGNVTMGGALNAVPDPSGPHPYSSDFFYSSGFPTLPSGNTYTVLLLQSGICQPVNVGNFST